MTTTLSPGTTTTARRRDVRPVPTTRLVKVELRKMFDTRSGFWMLVSIGVLSVCAAATLLVIAPDEDITHQNFARSIGFPMTVVLPMIAILSVTSEWSQRSGLTTFTLVPGRGRVIGAKAIATVLVGLGSMGLALVVGVVGNLLGPALVGLTPVWNVSPSLAAQFVLGHLVGMAIGFTLGVVMRSSAPAIVGYFVVSLVLSGVLELLGLVREWFLDVQQWVDWNVTQVALFDGTTNTAREWAMLGSTTMIWIVVPLAVGLVFLRRSEVK